MVEVLANLTKDLFATDTDWGPFLPFKYMLPVTMFSNQSPLTAHSVKTQSVSELQAVLYSENVCGGLNKISSLNPGHWDIRSPVGGGVLGGLGSVALLEEVCYGRSGGRF